MAKKTSKNAGNPKGKPAKKNQKIAMTLADKLVGERAEKVATKYETLDPQWAENRETGKRELRPLPKGLSKKDQKILRKVRKRARSLDYGLGSCCGRPIGWTALIGAIPGVEFADIILGTCLVNLKARKADVPFSMSLKMFGRQVLSTGVGSVPVAGDFFIAWYRANSRNSFQLEAFLEKRGLDNLADIEAKGGDVERAINIGIDAAYAELEGREVEEDSSCRCW
ncbi:hypothetical protein DFH11DRAFT_1861069 [Phellopilus nigrolimitatus]|nr:hypothetical protein DFH11DRAFT_1861069 [Phellopilus nigrolimitatus]